MTAERYYVKRPTGKVFGPFDKNAIQLMLKSNKLDADAEISADKEQWIALTQIPEFAQAIRDAGLDLPSPAGARGPTDLPSLPSAARQGGAFDLPSPVSASRGPSDLPSLPKSSGGFSDLPRPLGASQGFSDLPSPAGARGPADLPSLPKSGGGGGFNDLPKPTTAPGLPAPALPQGHNLPKPATPPANLPRPSASAPIAMSDDDDFGFDLPPMSGAGAGAQSRVDEDDLFGAPRQPAAMDDDDLFGPAPGKADDLFEISHGQADEDDLFGGPAPSFSKPTPSYQEDDDDLFGGPSQKPSPTPAAAPQAQHHEDPFSVPLGNPDDDLFGGGIGGHSSSANLEDDLFAGGSADHDEDDFLGGDQGFSFLDDKPAISAQGLNQDSWGDDLLGGQSQPQGGGTWNDELFSGNSTPQSTTPSQASPSSSAPAFNASPQASQPAMSQPQAAAHDPFRPASTGIKPPDAQPQQQQANAQTTQAQAAQDDKKRGVAVKIGVPILILLVLGGVGFGLVKFFDQNNTEIANQPVEVKRFKVDLDKLRTASFAELREIINASKKAQMKPDAVGKVLIAHAIVLAQHPNDTEILNNAKALAKQVSGEKEGEAALGKGALDAVIADLDTAKATLEPLASSDGDVGFFAKTFLGVAAVKELQKHPALPAAPEKDIEPAKTPAPDANAADMGADAGEDAPKPEAPKDTLSLAQGWLTDASKTDATLPMFWMGQLWESQPDKRQDANKAYAASLKATETYVPSLVASGRVNYNLGNLNDAIRVLERVSKELSARAHNEDTAEALHYIGKVYSARSESDAAIQSFTKALEVSTSRVDTLRALAEEYERAQQYKQALQFFTTNKNLGQKDPEVILGIGRAHSGLKQWTQAIAQLEVGEKAFPSDARFPEQLGQLNTKRGTFHEAQQAFERAVEIDPTLVSAHASLAQLAWRTEKDFERGEAHVRKIVVHPTKITAQVATEVAEFYRISGRLEYAKKWYAAAIKRDTNYWPARLALARMQLENGETKDALSLLERSRKEGVTDIRLSAYLADAYRQSKMYDRAVDEINRVIEKFPKNPEYIFIRGRIYFDRGNYETALEDFNKAYELDTRFHEAYFFVGRTAFAQGDKNTALKIFRHVLDYQPNDGEFRFYMGQALESESRLSQALEEYRKATEVDPGYGIRNPMIYIARGRVLAKLGDGREAKKDIARALEIAPEMTEALIAMGEADYRDQSYDAAIKNFTRALDREPKHPDAQHKLGMSYIYTKRNKEGAKHLQLALGYGASDPEIYRTLGFLYKEMGQRKEALEAFQAYWNKTLDKKIPAGTKREILNQIKELGG